MSAIYITNARMVQPGVGTASGSILLAEGKIAAINPAPQQLPTDCERIDAQDGLVTPGLIDIHTHGIHEFSYERDPEDLVEGSALVGRYGTTCVLPTLYKVLERGSLDQLERLASAIPAARNVDIPGLHLEGPFLAIPGAGASTVAGDLVLLEELMCAAHGRVRAMSVSPDCPRVVPVIERLRERDAAVFLTHTRATVAETQAAIDAGARHATHFYDVFPVPPEREPGVRPVGAVETILADERCTVDFICDGVHVDPMAIRLALAAKGWEGVIAITDSNVGAGKADGIYSTPWGYPVKVSESDAARVHDAAHPLDGLLAGSSLTMDRALTNLFEWLDLPAHQIWAMGTCNPAKVIGLPNKGVLRVGADADLVLWGQRAGRLQAVRTWVSGKCVFDRNVSAEVENLDHDKFVSV
ncbi:MAG: amidohydrolase family protein [Pirellulales bacterium]